MRAPIKKQVKISSFKLLTAGFRKKNNAEDHDQVRARSKDGDGCAKGSMSTDKAHEGREQCSYSAAEVIGKACTGRPHGRRKKLAEIRTHRTERSGREEA